MPYRVVGAAHRAHRAQKPCEMDTKAEQIELTCTAELSKAKIQQPQLVPSLVPIIAQHDVAACDIHMCHINYMEAAHCLHDTSAAHQ